MAGEWFSFLTTEPPCLAFFSLAATCRLLGRVSTASTYRIHINALQSVEFSFKQLGSIGSGCWVVDR